MRWLALALALLLPPAGAQEPAPVNPCTGLPIPVGTPISYYRDFALWNALAGPVCMPIKSLTSTGAFQESNAAGVVVYNFCKADGKWTLQLGVATWDFLIGKNLASNMRAALASDTPLTAFQQLVLANATTPLSDPTMTPVWCPHLAQIAANRPANDPPPPPVGDVYKTPATGLFTLFSYSGGRLTGVIAGRKAPPSTLCDCTAARATSGAKVLCSVGSPIEVTECVRQPP